MNGRRDFLVKAPLGLLGAAGAVRAQTAADTPVATPGAPPTFNGAAPAGPPISAATITEAGKLMQVQLSAAEAEMAAGAWSTTMAPLLERRTGPHAIGLDADALPASLWNPLSVAPDAGPKRNRFVRSAGRARPLPGDEAQIAYAPVTDLSRWLQARALTSERLTRIYLDRIARHDGVLRSVITLLADSALAQARAVDRDIAAGRYRGPLHGVPFGVKDLLDTAGIPTTWGSALFRDRIPAADAVVVSRLRYAGAVLLAKLSMGELALNDIWFGGQTMNPWLPQEGSSGSSAGPGAATAAGLVGFSIGSETGGSIISPSTRCGITGLRPTFGRVARTGAMTLCWSLDKLGPMTRSVEDALLVLQAITGPHAGDPWSLPSRLHFDAAASVKGLRVGYVPAHLEAEPATAVDRAALDQVAAAGMQAVPVQLPDWPYGSLDLILFAEAAASFERITLDGSVQRMAAQVPDAWPNVFRQSRYLSAVDFVQADRLRRKVAMEMARLFATIDVLLVPSLRGDTLSIFNQTGHPSLTLRTGSLEVEEARSDWAPDPAHPLPRFHPPRKVPHGVTFIGRLFDEGTLGRVGMAMERVAGVAGQTPPGF